MSDKENLRELINDLKNQLKEAQVKLEKLGKHERFKPEEDEEYYYVDNDNSICGTNFDNSFVDDKNRYNTYNCFRTQEEAQKEANKILIRRKLEDIARRLNGDKKIYRNNRKQRKYFINYYFNYKNNEFDLGVSWNEYLCVQGTVYCLSEKILDIAKEEIGEQELKDYIIGE